MKIKKYKLSELINGRDELNNKNKKIYKFFLPLFLIIIFFLFIYIYFFEIELNIKGIGVIESNSNISIVKNIIPGKVSSNYMKDGLNVKKGQVLFELDNHLHVLKYENMIKELDENKKFLDYILLGKSDVNALILKYKLELEQLKFKIEINKIEKERIEKEIENSEVIYSIEGISKKEVLNLKKEYLKITLNEKKLISEIEKFKLIKQKEVSNKIKELELELEKMKNIIDNNKIFASIDGELELEKYINVGDYIGSENLGKIIPKDNRYKVKLYINSEDINKIKIGDQVKYFLKDEKGVEYDLIGKIEYISNTLVNMNNNIYYYLYSTIENEKSFKLGLNVEFSILYDKKSIFNYILELIKK
ncbi:HlyD family efflux transporter periplasmic adaptor subunit [Streptobacillus moniliformis]|uniref:HlyD family efflux transporter periplasmic adaptor subunit n=1 Tax=Streptobacillus moniliformis TaxID=34105 RepID=UPI0007E36978|nr:HlyD family efflux transporter periplasmic adaptor subunit [Streptobacillus moniliformis]